MIEKFINWLRNMILLILFPFIAIGLLWITGNQYNSEVELCLSGGTKTKQECKEIVAKANGYARKK